MPKSGLRVAFFCTGALAIANAWSQPLQLWEDENRYGSSVQAGKSLDVNQHWRRDLEKAGVLSRNSPYRVALPLVSFGDNGPKLLLTYVPRMKDGSGSKTVLLFLRFNID
jgi:hypothetical protein